MKNSKQQSFSVSIRSKRQNLRTQIRRQQIEELFRAKRFEFFQEEKKDQKYQIYFALQQKIQECSNHFEAVESITHQIKSLFQKFPSQIWNFVMVGNLIIKRPEKIFELESLILREQNFQLSCNKIFAWCVGIYLTNLYNIINMQKNSNNYEYQIQKADRFMAELINKYWEGFKLSQESIQVMETHIFCYSHILQLIPSQPFFPIHTFYALFGNIQQFYSVISVQQKIFVRNIKIHITQLLNIIVIQIKTKELYCEQVKQIFQFPNQNEQKFSINISIVEKFIKFASEVYFENICDASDDRINCIESIKILCECYPIVAGEFLFTKKNVREFQYLMLNHSIKIRELLLSSFDYVLPILVNSKLIQFLDQSLHINLVHMLKRSLQEIHLKDSQAQRPYYNSLYLTLKVIEGLLHKVATTDNVILQNVLEKMNLNDFGDLIEGMAEKRYHEKIEEIESNLIDCFFSEDVCGGNGICNREIEKKILNTEFKVLCGQRNDNINLKQTCYNRDSYGESQQYII